MGVRVDSKKNQNISKDVPEKERRSFLKKIAYTAPSLLALGALARPTKLAAQSWDPGPGDQSTWTGGA